MALDTTVERGSTAGGFGADGHVTLTGAWDRSARSRSPQLQVTSFTAWERLSEPFLISAECFAEAPVDLAPHLGSGCLLSLQVYGESQNRDFSAVLFEIQELGEEDEGVRYRLTLRPWLSLLDLGRNTRLFQERTTAEIIEEVFSKAGFSAFDLSGATKAPRFRHYCVQYRESDFAFVSRLLEDEGLHYFFRHKDGSHTLVVADGAVGHEPSLKQSLDIRPPGTRQDDKAHLWKWGERLRPTVHKVHLRDSHFSGPALPYEARHALPSIGDNDKAELYDPAGAYGWRNDTGGEDYGAATAERRLQAARAARRVFRGEGPVFAVAVGTKLKVRSKGPSAPAEEFLVIETTHTFAGQAFRSDGGTGGGAGLSMDFEAIPYDTPWRPPLKTPRSVMSGPQTALVVGPDDQVIHCDEHGRIRVQFYWDRAEGKKADERSCWVRVSQGWADGGFGMMHLPRVGEEVVVDFLEGDPDRPLVTGRVYNHAKTPPYPLPTNKTKSVWRSQSVGDSGEYPDTEKPPKPKDRRFNEISFEDAGGKEEIYLHAQRDYRGWVRFNEYHVTGCDYVARVGHDRKTEIKRHETLIVEDGDELHQVKTGSRTTLIQATDALTVKQGDYTSTIEKGNHATTIKMGNMDTTLDMGNQSTKLKMGNFSMKVDLGKVTIEAMQSIELIVGQSKVKVDQLGVHIEGMMIDSKANLMTTVESKLMTTVKADAFSFLKGGLVFIN